MSWLKNFFHLREDFFLPHPPMLCATIFRTNVEGSPVEVKWTVKCTTNRLVS